MTLDAFKLRLSRWSIAFFLGSIQMVAMTALFADRVFLAALAVWSLVMGILLRRALRLFETRVPSAFAAIDAAFYLFLCGICVSFAWFCWTTPAVLSSGVGIAWMVVQVGVAVSLMLYLRNAIATARRLADR